jgi:type I restriction enzyme M protein
VLVTNGSQVQVFESITKNRISTLPGRQDLHKNLLNYLVSKERQETLRAEAKHELFIIDDVQTFKSILKSCHNEIRNNEGYDPTIAFDEMAKVLFCKLYEEKLSNNSNSRFCLSVFDDTLDRLKVNVVKQIFEETKKDARYAALFLSEKTLNLQDRTIRKIVSLFENYHLSLTAFDVKGEAFEYFLGDTFTGGLGEYFTPRNVVEFIVEAINPKIGDKVIDFYCGTGGFLIYAFEVVSEKIRLYDFSDEEKNRWRYELSNRSLYGTDWKERTAQACKMNMMVHGDGSAGIFMSHGLINIPGIMDDEKFNICFTNPPFGSYENDPEILKNYDLGKGRKSQTRLILGLERAVKLVKSGGKVGIVGIDGILNNTPKNYVRNYIKENAQILGVISLAPETFEGYGSRAKTSVLLLQKKSKPDDGSQKPVFMAIAKNTGYAPNGDQIPGNELPDIELAYKDFINGKVEFHPLRNCWIVSVGDRLDAESYLIRQDEQITQSAIEIEAEISRLLGQVNKEHIFIENSIRNAFDGQTYRSIELDELLQEIRIKEKVENDQIYRLLGVRWWGGGTFIREEKRGKEIKAKTLYRVSAGWIIYNRLFAFRGSFAIIDKSHDGGYISGEFPTFCMKERIETSDLLSRYIVHCLNNPKYLSLIETLSTGSTKTSRNRFNQKQFLHIKLDIPESSKGLEPIVNLLDRSATLRFKQEELLEKTKALHNSISLMIHYS